MRGIAPSEMENNLRGIVGKARGDGAEVLLLGMRIPPSFGQEHAKEFAAVYERISEDLEVPLVPFFMDGVAGDPKLNLQDGIHPTVAGHEKLAENVEDALSAALQE
jgi:acyl-CoA thioesterase-1